MDQKSITIRSFIDLLPGPHVSTSRVIDIVILKSSSENGKRSSFLSFISFTVLTDIHPFIHAHVHPFTRRRRCQPRGGGQLVGQERSGWGRASGPGDTSSTL